MEYEHFPLALIPEEAPELDLDHLRVEVPDYREYGNRFPKELEISIDQKREVFEVNISNGWIWKECINRFIPPNSLVIENDKSVIVDGIIYLKFNYRRINNIYN
jgi:hypothetical protein